MLATLLIFGCKKSDSSSSNNSNTPTGVTATVNGVTATVNGESILVTWNEVEEASMYYIYYSQNSDNGYSYLGYSYNTSYTHSSPNTENYYKVSYVNDNDEESDLSAYAYCHYSTGGGGGGGGGGQAPSAPSSISTSVSGSSVHVSWSSVSGANSYKIYRASSQYGSYSSLGSTYNTSYNDNDPMTDNYYKVTAVNEYGESDYSNTSYCHYSSGGGGGGGGGTTTPPSAPTGIEATFVGTTAVPNVKISWNSVDDATSYKVYRSTSPNGTYSQIGSDVTWTYAYDSNPKNGDNYYKVKAFNSAGGSSYSNYAVCNYNANAYSPCPPSITGSATSTSATITWTYSTSTGCGTPTTVVVKLYNPGTNSWIESDPYSSSTHSYTCYTVNTWVDEYGWVKFGVVVSNDYGTSSKSISYNPSTDQWIGG